MSLEAVETFVLGASRAFGGAVVHYDWTQAERIAETLRGRGVKMVKAEFNVSQNSHRALLMHQLIRRRALALPNDEVLLDELANVRLIETSPNVYRIDHDRGRHDDQATALSLAASALLSKPVYGPARLSSVSHLRLPKTSISRPAGGYGPSAVPSFVRKSHRGVVIKPGQYRPPEPNR